MSGIRVADFKKPSTIIVDQARVESSYGPKSSILLESLATSYSASGFTCSIKGLSRDSLLNDIFVTIPLQIRWIAGNGYHLLVNQYPDLNGLGKSDFVDGGQYNQYKSGANALTMYAYDNIAIRPNAFKCIRNATLSINGSSFSIRNDAVYTGLSKLFADGRKEHISGCDYECSPYTFNGRATSGKQQPGWFERCQALNTSGKVVYLARDGNNNIDDIVYQYDIKFPIWFGPWCHRGWPGLQHFDGMSVNSMPYISDLVLECNFTDDVIMDAFACSDDLLVDKLSSRNPPWSPLAGGAGADFTPNTHKMWASAKVDDATFLSVAAKTTTFVNILAPKLCYMWSEPNPQFTQLAPIYTVPSYRFISYEDRTVMKAGVETSIITFPQIRLANISSLYVVFAECDRSDNGATPGPRSARYRNADASWNALRQGMTAGNRTLRIKWNTVKVSMSVNSAVLANFGPETMTPQRQFELFKKYSGNAQPHLSLEEWEKHSSMLLFSAQELNGIGALGNSFQSMTMSIQFEVYRPCYLTSPQQKDYLASVAGGTSTTFKKLGQDKEIAVVGRFLSMEPELVSISEGAVSVQQVKLSQAELESQLLGGNAPEVEDAVKLEDYAR